MRTFERWGFQGFLWSPVQFAFYDGRPSRAWRVGIILPFGSIGWSTPAYRRRESFGSGWTFASEEYPRRRTEADVP